MVAGTGMTDQQTAGIRSAPQGSTKRQHKRALGAVMPLCVRGSYDVDDLNRAEILFRTLQAFAEPGLIDPFLVVTPPDEVNIVAERYARWKSLNIEVLSEEELVPELANYRELRGWRRQQIVKLAAARRIERDFFITFDADVLCLKPLSYDDLIIDGRALLQYEERAHHPQWWKSSARILGMSPATRDPDMGMHVTPAVLSTALCHNLAAELSGSTHGTWVDVLGWLHRPRHPSNWTIERFRRRRWTEYSLYYMCALKRGELDRYHVRAGTDEHPQLLSVGCKHEFETWDTAASFSPDGPSFFCLVGSKSRVEPQAVWEHIKPFLPGVELQNAG